MDVTVSGSLLKLTFRFDRRIIDCIKTVPGYLFNESDKCWYVPAAQLSKLEELFPRAHYDYACWQAEAEAMQRSAAQLHSMLVGSGATFSVSEGDIVLVEGDCVSPLVADIVRERSSWIAPLVGQSEPAAVGEAQREQRPEAGAPRARPTRGDELLASSIANAVKAEKRKAAQRSQWWERSEMKQGALELDD